MALSVQYARNNSVARNDTFCVFDLVDILSGHILLLNISLSIVSLLCLDGSYEHAMVAQRLLTEAEMRVLLPLLNAPTCCQQEVLQASISCTYELLLQSLLSSGGKTSSQWNELVQQQRDRLHRAQEQKTQRTEMRGVYNAMSGLRHKLEQFGLTVRSRRDGYYLALIAS